MSLKSARCDCYIIPVYRYSSAQFGPQYVQAAFDERPVGHIDDDMLGGGTGYGKEPPSKPKLTLV